MKKVLLLVLGLFLFQAQANHWLPENGNDLSMVEITPSQEKKVKLYPNPARDYFTLEAETNESIVQVSIYSLLGNEILTQKFNTKPSESLQFNVSSFKKGKYLVRVIFANGTSEVKALIKQ